MAISLKNRRKECLGELEIPQRQLSLRHLKACPLDGFHSFGRMHVFFFVRGEGSACWLKQVGCCKLTAAAAPAPHPAVCLGCGAMPRWRGQTTRHLGIGLNAPTETHPYAVLLLFPYGGKRFRCSLTGK